MKGRWSVSRTSTARLLGSRLLDSLRAITLVGLTACAVGGSSSAESFPRELVGRWVRQLDSGSWGDTLEFRPDGTVGGSATNRVPPSARWGVKTAVGGMPMFCAGDAKESSCQTYTTSGDRLIVDNGPSGKTTYRRVP
jgi:hypothetical protein